MKPVLRYALPLLVLTLVTLAGWKIVATRVSDWLAPTQPGLALEWDARNPQALLALAHEQLEAGHPQEAAASARRVLEIAPLEADAFAALARAAEASGQDAEARRLFAIALQRAPRNAYVRGWTIGTQLHDGDYDAALRNVDVLLDTLPGRRQRLLPLLTRLADEDPAFAQALGRHLGTEPPWREAMLENLLSHGTARAVAGVFEAVQAEGKGLGVREAGRWFAQLKDAGRWGEAYSRWTAWAGIRDGRIPAIHDGGFELPATGVGFDWGMRGEPGVTIKRTRTAGMDGAFAAEVIFRGRRANDIGFGQILMLAPGDYTLTFRAAAEALRSDNGLQWNIYCVEGGAPLATGPMMYGTFDWKTLQAGFTVPAGNCPAQRLALVNPGAEGSGKVVSGTAWFDGFSIDPAPPRKQPCPPETSSLPAAGPLRMR